MYVYMDAPGVLGVPYMYICMPACIHVLCMCATDWRGAGFTRGLAVPRGTRGGAGRSHAYFCGAVRLRAYDIDCGRVRTPRC